MEIKVPAVGESITEATIAEWTKKSGEAVARDDVLLVLETDKASVEVVAEAAGVLNIKVEEGETVEVGAVIGEIDENATASASSSAPAKEDPTPPPPAEAKSNGSSDAHPELQKVLSPATRRVVEENNLNPDSISGTGRGGRITKSDAMSAVGGSSGGVETVTPAPTPSTKPSAPPPMPQPKTNGSDEEQTRTPMTRLRKTIAERLVNAQQTAAILTTFNEIDMGAVMELRKKYKDSFKEKYGISLGFMGFFVKATVQALKEYPLVNAFIDGTDVVQNNYVNMGIAVSTEKGLVVPSIKRADLMTVAEIEMAIRHYAIKARDGKISIDDLSGGTFTISNGGVFGSLMSTPILNPPQSGILGLHKIEERPVAINGEVKIRPMMYAALSYDHRIVDGKESVSFLVKIKEAIEDPSRLLLEI